MSKVAPSFGASFADSTLAVLAILHPHPAIPPHILAMSLRFLISLSLAASSASIKVTVRDYPTFHDELITSLQGVLEAAMYLEGGSGSQRPWLGLIAADDQIGQSTQLGDVIHPSQPPLSRPLPPMSSLAFYSCESDQEKELREELGLAVATDPLPEASPVNVPQPSPPAQSVVVQAPAPAPAPESSRGPAEPATQPAPIASIAPPSSAAEVEAVAADVEMAEAVATEEPPAVIPLASSTPFMPAPPSASQVVTTPSVRQKSPVIPRAASTAREGARYDSEGEEMPEINLESDTDEDEEDGDDDNDNDADM